MFKGLLSSLFSIAILSVSFVGSANANLIVNGGFEDATVTNGWRYYDSSVVTGWNGDNLEIWDNFGRIGAFEGEKHAELNAHPYDGTAFTIFQSFDTVIGQSYDVSFAYGARKSNKETFKVEFAGNTVVLSDHTVNNWSVFEQSFKATQTSTTLSFTSIVPGARTVGNFLDAISVETSVDVPEPSMVALFISLLAFAGFRRKA